MASGERRADVRLPQLSQLHVLELAVARLARGGEAELRGQRVQRRGARLEQQRGGTQLGGGSGGGGGGGYGGFGGGRAAAADRPGSMAALREARLTSLTLTPT